MRRLTQAIWPVPLSFRREGAVGEKCLGSHPGMADPVPGSASPRLNSGWVPQCFGHSTARQLGRGSHYLGSRKVTSVAVYGVPLVGKKEGAPVCNTSLSSMPPGVPLCPAAPPAPGGCSPSIGPRCCAGFRSRSSCSAPDQRPWSTPLRLKIDPGSRTTGLALVRET